MADGGRQGLLAGAREGKAGRDFIGRATLRGGIARASYPTVATAWCGGGWRRAAGGRPVEEGGARSGVCAATAWHRSRGWECVTALRRIVPTAPSLGPIGLPVSRCARARVRWRADVVRRGVTSCGCRHSGSKQFQVSHFELNFLQISKPKCTNL
jgi:hypothetical protein